MKKLIVTISVFLTTQFVSGQGCCSGGSASPIAGGTSQGVLNEKQIEIAGTYQYMSSDKFMSGNRDTAKMVDQLSSQYSYLRFAYGVTKKLTFSLESGYYFSKRQIEINNSDTLESKGIADLIIFPRYQVFYKCNEDHKTEVVVGLGMKFPLGSHNDSTVIFHDPVTNENTYTTKPPTIQLSTGSNDFIFYSFWYRNFLKKKFRVFANTIYVHKGWNSIGQKFGDYGSMSLFLGANIYKRLSGLVQLKGEWIGKMKADPLVDMIAFYNVYPSSTGSHKLFIAPQINYFYKNWNFFTLTEIPIYQYLNGVQIASKINVTCGISYKINCCKEQN